MIRPEVRAKLEQIGIDVVRTKLAWIMNVTPLSEPDKFEPLRDGVSAKVSEIQEWLAEKDRRERLWVRIGVIAAVAAAVFALLAWLCPIR